MTVTDKSNSNSDAFGSVAMESYALNPVGAHIFRAQHEAVLRQANRISVCIAQGIGPSGPGREQAVSACIAMTTMISLLSIHQSLEESLVRRMLSGDPRLRTQIDQYEREIAPVISEFHALTRKFTSPSVIAEKGQEFAQAFTSVLSMLQERFKSEERDLFGAYDRAVRIGLPSGAILDQES